MVGARIHWKCNTNLICPNAFLCLHSRNVERKQNHAWTNLRRLGNYNVKTQHHLDNSQMLTLLLSRSFTKTTLRIITRGGASQVTYWMVGHLRSHIRSPGASQVAPWMVGHLGSNIRSPGTSRVTYWMVGHLGSKTRSPSGSQVAYWMVGHLKSKIRFPGTCKMACWMVGHFAIKFAIRVLAKWPAGG